VKYEVVRKVKMQNTNGRRENRRRENERDLQGCKALIFLPD
jgi:hypothetical protein